MERNSHSEQNKKPLFSYLFDIRINLLVIFVFNILGPIFFLTIIGRNDGYLDDMLNRYNFFYFIASSIVIFMIFVLSWSVKVFLLNSDIPFYPDEKQLLYEKVNKLMENDVDINKNIIPYLLIIFVPIIMGLIQFLANTIQGHFSFFTNFIFNFIYVAIDWIFAFFLGYLLIKLLIIFYNISQSIKRHTPDNKIKNYIMNNRYKFDNYRYLYRFPLPIIIGISLAMPMLFSYFAYISLHDDYVKVLPILHMSILIIALFLLIILTYIIINKILKNYYNLYKYTIKKYINRDKQEYLEEINVIYSKKNIFKLSIIVSFGQLIQITVFIIKFFVDINYIPL